MLDELVYRFERIKKRLPLLDAQLTADIDLFYLDLQQENEDALLSHSCYDRCCGDCDEE